jgi:hypothetical protein
MLFMVYRGWSAGNLRLGEAASSGLWSDIPSRQITAHLLLGSEDLLIGSKFFQRSVEL